MGSFTTAIKKVKTRVDHECSCFAILDASEYGLADLPSKYHEAVLGMSKNKGVIKKGRECYFWSGCFDGDMFTAYADIEMYNLISHMDWFDV